MALRTLKGKPSAQALIEAHNQDPEAHPELNSILDLNESLSDLDERLSALEESSIPTDTLPGATITITAQNVYIGYNGSVDLQPYPEPEYPEFDDIPEDELEQYGIRKACPERSRRTRTRKAYKLLKTYSSLDQEKIDYGVLAVGAPNAWKETKGEGVTVMVLDTGISPKHPDLKPNIIDTLNFTDTRTPWDRDGHGTFCAGLVAGIDNGKGIIGVAPRTKIISGKVLDDDGYGYDSWIAKGIRWAIRNKKRYGIEILSLSLGGDSYEPVLKRTFIAAKKAGLILVCAAGNEATPETQQQEIDTIGYPARFASEGLCISVGAIDPNMNLADFSSTGPELSFVAPGVDVTSSWPKRSYATLSGTSFSTPIIAGVCALAIAKHRKLGGATPINGLDDMAEHLKKISHDLGIAGKDNWFGYGIPKISS